MVEILAPVGDWEMLASAVNSGADSVYFGVSGLNMREGAKNFEKEELPEIMKRLHENSMKGYLTLNTIVYDKEIPRAEELVRSAKEAGVDAVICWDQAVISICRREGIECHLSTQASVANYESLKFYREAGVKRFILARELSLEQVKSIKKRVEEDGVDAEIECFIHGAMCVSVSGRCFMSQFSTGRSANRGECTQPCRRSYEVVDSSGEFNYELHSNYVMSPKDLCTIDFIDRFLDAGIDSFKIEGRMRGADYVKRVVEGYRRAVELHGRDELSEEAKKSIKESFREVYNRGFSRGFYMGEPVDQWSGTDGSRSKKRKRYIGRVTNFYKKIGVAEVMLENHSFSAGETLLFTGNKTGAVFSEAEEIQLNNQTVEKAEKGSKYGVKIDSAVRVRENDRVFLVDERPGSE